MIYEYQARDFHSTQPLPVDQFISKTDIDSIKEFGDFYDDENIMVGPDSYELPNSFGWED